MTPAERSALVQSAIARKSGGMALFGLAESAIRHHLQRRAERRFVQRVRRLTR